MKTFLESFHSSRRFWTRRNLWLGLVTLAMGALGVWSAADSGDDSGPNFVSRSLQVSVHSGGANADMTLTQMDGTVWANGNAFSGGAFLTANDWKAASGQINVGTGVATAQGTAAATVWSFGARDTSTWNADSPTMTPASVDFAMEVTDTSGWALGGNYIRRGLMTPATWDASADRVAFVNVVGQEALTLDGGALSLKVDGKPFVTGQGGQAHLKQNYSQTVRILQ